MVVGNTPGVRGELVAQLQRTHPESLALSVSVRESTSGHYPVVQRMMTTADGRPTAAATMGATGDPAIILRQDLISLHRARKSVHVILALPEHLDPLPFLLDLWRSRVGADNLEDHYDAALVVAGITASTLLTDITCVHQAFRVWSGGGHREPLTPAEIAARQVEAADAVVLAGPSTEDGAQEAAALLRHLNPRAGMVTLDRVIARQPASGRVLARPQAHAPMRAQWEARLEPTSSPYAAPDPGLNVSTVVWRARRPLHPERLADALGEVMLGVLRSRGHLWLASRPDAVVTWRSAGGHLELIEADRWLEAHASPAWEAASPQRRTLACWFWDDQYGERRNEIVFTGTSLDADRITGALDGALLDEAEVALDRESWSHWHDPLLGSP
ncbi:GTP-binding protein [Streptomyces sp. NPDC090029]|uniref:GTP-binding protein n=1 Tax=Streptomyces sp. NPDC090029 TaxID=3365924 RepID=UPI0038017E64